MKTLLAGIAASTALAALAAPADSMTSAPTLTARSSAYGKILFDGRGYALYAFTRDPRGGKSHCYGACAQAWPVYYKHGAPTAGRGVSRRLIGFVKRKDGRRQVTYNGRPLYYYVNDRRPGQVLCQDVFEYGGRWLVVRPSGKLVR